MKSKTEVAFFDLFYTLVKPVYDEKENKEYEVINLSVEQWEEHSEDDELYLQRATGVYKEPLKIIERILEKINISIEEEQIKEILRLRVERFKNSLINVDPRIITTLENLKKDNIKLCLISNADAIDILHWNESPLSKLFDDVVFSVEVGFVKPQHEIFEIAIGRMNAKAENCFFIGDGGSHELRGAKEIGIRTIRSFYLLEEKSKHEEEVNKYADFAVNDFSEIERIMQTSN